MTRVIEKDSINLKKNADIFFETIKQMTGITDIETPKMIFDFETPEEFEKYCIDYIEKHNADITEFANKIFLLNEEAQVTKKGAIELYTLLLTGFMTYLLKKKIDEM